MCNSGTLPDPYFHANKYMDRIVNPTSDFFVRYLAGNCPSSLILSLFSPDTNVIFKHTYDLIKVLIFY